jgi:hypothetical protein
MLILSLGQANVYARVRRFLHLLFTWNNKGRVLQLAVGLMARQAPECDKSWEGSQGHFR